MTLWPGAPYEYARSARGFVFAAGACPIDSDGAVVHAGDVRAQSEVAIENLRAALGEHGAGFADVVKATVFVVAKERADLLEAWSVMAPHLERAPATLLGVSLLGYPDQLVEVEAIAVYQPAGGTT